MKLFFVFTVCFGILLVNQLAATYVLEIANVEPQYCALVPSVLSCREGEQISIKSGTLTTSIIGLWHKNYDVTEEWHKYCHGVVKECRRVSSTCGQGDVVVNYDCIPCNQMRNRNCQKAQFISLREKVHQTSLKYCFSTRQRRNSAVPTSFVSLAAVILLYRSLEHVSFSQFYNTQVSPITEIGTIELAIHDRVVYLPAVMRATIYSRHLQSENSRRPFGADVALQMQDMSSRQDDERGHLLAHCLGGTETALNIVPMARNVNRHFCSGNPDFKGELKADKMPLSFWRSNEEYMTQFLRTNPGGRVEWNLALWYEDDVYFQRDHPPNSNLRPTYIITQFTTYLADGTVHFQSNDIVYVNNNEYQCSYTEHEP